MNLTVRLKKWRNDPVAFIQEALCDPETGKPFKLYPEQTTFLRRAFTLKHDGRLPYEELLFSAIKKSGKTTLAAMILIYVIRILGGKFAEGYTVANDFEQSQGRVFQAACRIIEASPLLSGSAAITQNKITFPDTGSTITALASDYAGAAGANPNITVFDELWGYTSERSIRLWDEMISPPTRKVACRLTVSYAGFEGESKLLEGLFKKAEDGTEVEKDLYESPGLLAYISHEPKAPWQTEAWITQMRGQLRPNAFLRMIQNLFVSGEEQFLPIEWWDRAAISTPVVKNQSMNVTLGIDAGLKKDNAAVVACCFDSQRGKIRLVNHRIFHPHNDEPLDLEGTLEETVRDFSNRYSVMEIKYDPWQFQRSAQTLLREGFPMVEYPQSLPNLTAMSTNLYELLKGGNLIAYPDDEIRQAISHAVAVETSRGMKISKEKASHKIDVVVALAMASLGATQTRREPRLSFI